MTLKLFQAAAEFVMIHRKTQRCRKMFLHGGAPHLYKHNQGQKRFLDFKFFRFQEKILKQGGEGSSPWSHPTSYTTVSREVLYRIFLLARMIISREIVQPINILLATPSSNPVQKKLSRIQTVAAS